MNNEIIAFIRLALFTNPPWENMDKGIPSAESIFLFVRTRIAECLEECLHAKLGEELTELLNTIDNAEKAILDNDKDSICQNMFKLGMNMQKLSISPEKYTVDLQTDFNRKRQLFRKSQDQRAISSIAQQFAQEKWALDRDKKISLSEMCQEVYAKLYDYLKNQKVTDEDLGNRLFDALPKDASSLKKALRVVAPAYATKPGRRKK